MQPGATGPGQDPNQHDPYQPYPPGYGQVPQFPDPLFAPGPEQPPATPTPYSTPPAGEQYPTAPEEYNLYPPQPQYGQQQYGQQQPQYGQYPQSPPAYPPAGYSVPPATAGQGNGNIFGLLAMIFGIISLPLMFCCYLGVPFGIAAIVLGILGNQRVSSGQANNKGMALAGIICGAAGIALLVILIGVGVGLNALPTTH